MFTCCYHYVDRYTENLTIYDTLQDVYLLALGSTAEFTCLAIANDATSLEYFYRRTDATSIGSNVVRPVHDGPSIDGRTTMHINGITAANDGEYECLVRDIVPGGDFIVLDRRTFTITVTCKTVTITLMLLCKSDYLLQLHINFILTYYDSILVVFAEFMKQITYSSYTPQPMPLVLMIHVCITQMCCHL